MNKIEITLKANSMIKFEILDFLVDIEIYNYYMDLSSKEKHIIIVDERYKHKFNDLLIFLEDIFG